MSVTTLHVTGMTCGHCVSAVTSELTALDGVESVEVALVAGGTSAVTVHSSHAVPMDAMRAAVDEAGYELAEG
jgi:copper chaperone CopZ